MKFNIYILVFFIAVGLFSSCKEEELSNFSAKETILFEGNIPSNNTYTPIDTNSFSFGYVPDHIKDSLFFVSVLATGGPREVDRPYRLEFLSSGTMKEGVDYELLTKDFAIPAKSVRDVLVFRLFRTDKMKKDSLSLDLKLQANDNFVTQMEHQIIGTGENQKLKNFTQLHFTVDDIAGAPWFWDPKKNSSATGMMGYLGDFSAKKFQIMASRYSWDVAVVTAEGYRPPVSILIAWCKSMQAYLNEMEILKTPVLELDGTLMKMGKYAQ